MGFIRGQANVFKLQKLGMTLKTPISQYLLNHGYKLTVDAWGCIRYYKLHSGSGKKKKYIAADKFKTAHRSDIKKQYSSIHSKQNNTQARSIWQTLLTPSNRILLDSEIKN